MIPTSEENSKTVSRSLDITNYDDGYNYTDIIFGIHDQASYIRHSRDVYEENIDEKSLTAYDFLFFVYVGMVFLLIIGSAIMSVKIINVMGEAVKLDYQTNEKRSGNESMDEKEMLDCYRRRNHCRNYNKECNKESNSTNRECSSVNRECNIASKKLPAVPESPKKRYTPKFNGRNSSKGCMTTIPASLNGIDETVNKKNDKRVCVATDKILEEINPSPKEERSTSSTNIHTNAPMTNIHNAAMAQLLDSKHHQKRKEKINKKEVVPFQINNPMPRTNSRGRSGRSVSTPRPRPLNPPPKDTDEIYNSKRTSVLSDTNSEHYHGSYHPQEYYTSSPHPNSLENESELIKSVFSTEFRKSPGFDRYFDVTNEKSTIKFQVDDRNEEPTGSGIDESSKPRGKKVGKSKWKKKSLADYISYSTSRSYKDDHLSLAENTVTSGIKYANEKKREGNVSSTDTDSGNHMRVGRVLSHEEYSTVCSGERSIASKSTQHTLSEGNGCMDYYEWNPCAEKVV